MDIALPNDPQMPYDPDGNLAEEVIFTIAESLTWGDHDTFAGVNPHGVEIFHVANGDTVIKGVTDNLVFHFLPSFEELLKENLSTMRKGFGGSLAYCFFIDTHRRTKPAERIGDP